MRVTNYQFSDKNQTGRFIVIFHNSPQQFDLVDAITLEVFHVSCPDLFCMLLIVSSDKLNYVDVRKNIQNVRFIVFFEFFCQ